MNKVGLGIGLIAMLIVVAVSGCTSDNTTADSSSSGSSAPSGEQLLGTYDVSTAPASTVFGSKKLLVQLPQNSAVRVTYQLKGDQYGSNGNMGTTVDKVVEGSGESPFGLDNQYLEAGAGMPIQGELKLDSGGKTFYYEGSFASGTISVYYTP